MRNRKKHIADLGHFFIPKRAGLLAQAPVGRLFGHRKIVAPGPEVSELVNAGIAVSVNHLRYVPAIIANDIFDYCYNNIAIICFATSGNYEF